MNNKIDIIIDHLSNLNLLEVTKLVKKIEEIFGVTTANENTKIFSPSVITVTPNEIEEKTEFKLFLEEVPSDKKIAILKIIRTITGFGLKESKDLVDSAPKLIKEGMIKESAELAKKQLEDVGAKVTIK
jgi:large subunit ribosomal protein L7/L12